jgi:ATP-dependent RNA helicase DDX27
MLRAAIKHAAAEDQVRHRVLPTEALQRWADKLVDLKNEISDVLREEKEEKQIRQAEMELKKGQNIIDHQNEIFSRPARTWFQTGREKKASQCTLSNIYFLLSLAQSDISIFSDQQTRTRARI